jgi:hypothetical protein
LPNASRIDLNVQGGEFLISSVSAPMASFYIITASSIIAIRTFFLILCYCSILRMYSGIIASTLLYNNISQTFICFSHFSFIFFLTSSFCLEQIFVFSVGCVEIVPGQVAENGRAEKKIKTKSV